MQRIRPTLGFSFGLFNVPVQGFKIEIQLSEMLRLELADLQFHGDEAGGGIWRAKYVACRGMPQDLYVQIQCLLRQRYSGFFLSHEYVGKLCVVLFYNY